MKLKTIVNVTCSENGKVQPYNGKVIGKLLTVIMFPMLQVSWQYQKEDGTPLLTGATTLTNEEADLLLTTPITSIEVAEQVFYGAMRVEMASAFEISVNQIEEIND
jgi:hypothetical protein